MDHHDSQMMTQDISDDTTDEEDHGQGQFNMVPSVIDKYMCQKYFNKI